MTESSTTAAARRFLTTHARMLDRHRFAVLDGSGAPEGAPATPATPAALAALAAYRNADGGYGHGLEPDLRSPESQPAAALHAFEVLAEVTPVTTPAARELCDWLTTVALPDGGLPFALPIGDSVGCAPFWTQADHATSSLQITAVVALHAHRVAAHDRGVADHPWLARATEYCVAAILRLRHEERVPHAYELAFAVRFADALHGAHSETARELLTVLGAHVPATGLVPVQGGAPGETLRPLDLCPQPGPANALLTPEVVRADLDRLRDRQAEDGGWTVDFASYSPAAALDWRGYTTVNALRTLAAYGS
ncbi:hypothetical protein FFT09_17500 [Saccharomonospora piscinae]|uniref:hypothetical protein n=1 Tax=Saccharomonospora piscinae TaxID=687388 RepID=UPI001106951C|nr:hypothetical protein [Saccharomonospora piscinae]TLW91068.1 hypothetical protein FFT09_17500 [Saccharomonospora piscinae]